MSQWIMAHPWMFFAMVALGLIVLDNIVVNVVKAIVAKAELETAQEKEQKEEVP